MHIKTAEGWLNKYNVTDESITMGSSQGWSNTATKTSHSNGKQWKKDLHKFGGLWIRLEYDVLNFYCIILCLRFIATAING